MAASASHVGHFGFHYAKLTILAEVADPHCQCIPADHYFRSDRLFGLHFLLPGDLQRHSSGSLWAICSTFTSRGAALIYDLLLALGVLGLPYYARSTTLSERIGCSG